MLSQAICFAAKAHDNSYRKGSVTPYIVHPAETLAIAASLTDDEDVLCAAVLHDTLEDTLISKEEIKNCFNQRVLHYVLCETEDKHKGLPSSETWMQRKQSTIDRLKSCCDINEKILVLSDKLSNIRAIFRDQLTLKDKVWEKFNNQNKSDHKYYYESIALNLKELACTIAYKEFIWYIDKVFNEE